MVQQLYRMHTTYTHACWQASEFLLLLSGEKKKSSKIATPPQHIAKKRTHTRPRTTTDYGPVFRCIANDLQMGYKQRRSHFESRIYRMYIYISRLRVFILYLYFFDQIFEEFSAPARLTRPAHQVKFGLTFFFCSYI